MNENQLLNPQEASDLLDKLKTEGFGQPKANVNAKSEEDKSDDHKDEEHLTEQLRYKILEACDHGMTQTRIAGLCGLNQGTISKIVSGAISRQSKETVARIAMTIGLVVFPVFHAGEAPHGRTYWLRPISTIKESDIQDGYLNYWWEGWGKDRRPPWERDKSTTNAQ